MKKLKHLSFSNLSQKGFSHVELFAMLIVVTAIAFIGAKVYLFNSHADTGYVHVVGTQIYDANNNPIYLSGVDGGSWMTRGEGTTPSACGQTYSGDPTQAASLKNMGFNTERIAITWANIEPTAPTVNADGSLTHHWNEQYLAELDNLIQADQHAGIMVILDMHQASGWSPAFTAESNCGGNGQPNWLYPHLVSRLKASIAVAECEFFTNKKDASSVPETPQDGMAAAWQMVASRYNTNATVIGTDLFNEPHTGCAGGSIVNMYEKLGAAVRVGSPRMVLMYEDNAYDSYMNQGFELESQPHFTNAVYSWHLYSHCWAATCSTPGQAAMQAHLNRALSWHVPLWIGETDAMDATRTPDLTPGETPELTAQMNYFLKNGLNGVGGNGKMDISWTLWGYNNGCCSIVRSGNTAKPLLLALLQPYLYKPSSVPHPHPPTPTVTISAPSSGATASGRNVSVAASASVSSGSITNITLKANGVTIGTCSNLATATATCTKSWDSTAVANGAYTIEADTTASDGKSASATESVTVTNSTLSVSITSPRSGATVRGNVPITVNTSGNITKSKVAWDSTLIRNVTATSVDAYGWGSLWNSQNVPNGRHTLTVTVWDAAGDSRSDSVTVTSSN